MRVKPVEYKVENQGESGLTEATLSNGIVAKFREAKVKDIRELDNAGVDKNVELAVRLAVRLCVQWGDKSGVTLPELDELSLADFKRVSEAIAGFLRDASELG